MIVQSFLIQGAATSAAVLTGRIGTLSPASLDALVFMSLGMDHPTILDVIQKLRHDKMTCPVYLTETYGILGFDEDLGKNVEIMEKGRGTEYGCQGGNGGQGCLVVGYSSGNSGGKVLSGSGPEFPPNASSLMIIADQSGGWSNDKVNAPIHYGGITKTTWKVDEADDGSSCLTKVPYFWIAQVDSDTAPKQSPIGISTFKEENGAGPAVTSMLSKLPSGFKADRSVGLFPCFTRGVNLYAKDHVEPREAAAAMESQGIKNPRVYGMFAHGELGPSSFADFVKETNSIDCTKHSMTTILSIHTTPAP